MSQSDFIIPLGTALGDAVPIAYYVLCGLGGLLTLSSVIVQCCDPAPYGKFAESKSGGGGGTTGEEVDAASTLRQQQVDDQSHSRQQQQQQQQLAERTEPASPAGCCLIPQRIAHIVSDFPPGVILFIAVYCAAVPDGVKPDLRSKPSHVMAAFWVAHFFHRGLIHPLLMRYSAATVELGICVGGMLPNCIFSAAMALHVSCIAYSASYFYDARFIVGVVVFVVGFVGNRWADMHLRSLREQQGEQGHQQAAWTTTAAAATTTTTMTTTRRSHYVLPTEGLFRLCFCPNYFFEFLEWCGFAILTSSLVGVVFALFGLSTFLPRSLATKKWYLGKFPDTADPSKAALVPWIL